MPFFQIDNRLVYYAHVPKCGGSSIARYIQDRFGPLAFHDNAHASRPEAARWTLSSPQHVDADTLAALIPPEFFAASFAVVRHPVPRLISVYHFQKEVAGTIGQDMTFSDWLHGPAAPVSTAPFAFDNHVRPMSQIVPAGAAVFHLEHGIDALVPWFDAIAGHARGPRAILPENVRGDFSRVATEKVRPTEADTALIARRYAEDFERFGYRIEDHRPMADPPVLDAATLAARDRALARARQPLARIARKVRHRLQRR